MDLDLQKIGFQVKSARIAKHMTQQQLADSAGISVPILRAIEKGKQSMSVHTLIGITNTLGISTDSLINDDPPDVNGIKEQIRKELATLTPVQYEKFMEFVQELEQKRSDRSGSQDE